MTIEQVYSDLLLRIQNAEALYAQMDSHVLHSFTLFWTIVLGVLAIIGVALYFIVQQVAEKGVKKHAAESQQKLDDCERRITSLEIALRDAKVQMQSGIDERAKVETGYYTGTGTWGSPCPNALVFPFEPKVVIVSPADSESTSLVLINPGVCDSSAESNGESPNPSAACDNYPAWRGDRVSWYNAKGARYQFNEHMVKYYFTAIG